jgi:hypothetical protein
MICAAARPTPGISSSRSIVVSPDSSRAASWSSDGTGSLRSSMMVTSRSSMRVVSLAICALRVSIWSSSIRASSA